jgi:hypothetical protein
LNARQGSSGQEFPWSEASVDSIGIQEGAGTDHVTEQGQQAGTGVTSKTTPSMGKSGSMEGDQHVTSLDAVLKGTSFLRLLRGLAQPIAAQAPQMTAQQLAMCLKAFAAAQVNPGKAATPTR